MIVQDLSGGFHEVPDSYGEPEYGEPEYGEAPFISQPPPYRPPWLGFPRPPFPFPFRPRPRPWPLGWVRPSLPYTGLGPNRMYMRCAVWPGPAGLVPQHAGQMQPGMPGMPGMPGGMPGGRRRRRRRR